MAGNSNSGRRPKGIERNAVKLERMAVKHAIEIYDSGTPSQKLELTKQIAPKCVQRVTDPSAGNQGGKIMIMIVPREQIEKEKLALNAPQQVATPPVIEIVAEDVPTPHPIKDNASNAILEGEKTPNEN